MRPGYDTLTGFDVLRTCPCASSACAATYVCLPDTLIAVSKADLPALPTGLSDDDLNGLANPDG